MIAEMTIAGVFMLFSTGFELLGLTRDPNSSLLYQERLSRSDAEWEEALRRDLRLSFLPGTTLTRFRAYVRRQGGYCESNTADEPLVRCHIHHEFWPWPADDLRSGTDLEYRGRCNMWRIDVTVDDGRIVDFRPEIRIRKYDPSACRLADWLNLAGPSGERMADVLVSTEIGFSGIKPESKARARLLRHFPPGTPVGSLTSYIAELGGSCTRDDTELVQCSYEQQRALGGFPMVFFYFCIQWSIDVQAQDGQIVNYEVTKEDVTRNSLVCLYHNTD